MIQVADRVPRYPGRVRLTPVPGQDGVFDLVRADEPLEQGTPINKALFDSIAPFGTCSTAAATVAKVVAASGFVLNAGASVTVKFTYANTAENPTLNVNSTGAAALYRRGTRITAATPWLLAGGVYTFVYTGTNYELVADDSNAMERMVTATPDGVSVASLNLSGFDMSQYSKMEIQVGMALSAANNVYMRINADVGNNYAQASLFGPNSQAAWTNSVSAAFSNPDRTGSVGIIELIRGPDGQNITAIKNRYTYDGGSNAQFYEYAAVYRNANLSNIASLQFHVNPPIMFVAGTRITVYGVR